MYKKIAVLRANALGDYIFVVPALQALKETFPEAEIILLGRAWHEEFLEGRPGPVDRVIVVPPYPGITEREGFEPNPEELDAFFLEMQNERFDVALQLHGGGKNSNPFILRLGAKLTVGLKTPDAADLDISVPYVYYFSEILRYLEVVSKIEATTHLLEPEINLTEKDVADTKAALQDLPNRPLAIIHPGASDLRRRWPAPYFAEIASFLAQKGYEVCITGVAFEEEVVEEILTNIPNKDNIRNLCNKISLKGMTGLLAAAELLVSNDTGPLHLARALKTPTIGIYWCGNAITGLSMTTSIHRMLPSFIVNCPLCGLSNKLFSANDDCKHETSFVADVTVEEVKAAIDELLDSRKAKEHRQLSNQVITA